MRQRRSGGQGRNRTTDTRIFSPLLYQLSYLAGSWDQERTREGGVLNRPRAGGSSNGAWIRQFPPSPDTSAEPDHDRTAGRGREIPVTRSCPGRWRKSPVRTAAPMPAVARAPGSWRCAAIRGSPRRLPPDTTHRGRWQGAAGRRLRAARAAQRERSSMRRRRKRSHCSIWSSSMYSFGWWAWSMEPGPQMTVEKPASWNCPASAA